MKHITDGKPDMMPYRVAAGLLEHLLPVEIGMSPETLRSHTLKVGEQVRDATAVKPAVGASVTAKRSRAGRE